MKLFIQTVLSRESVAVIASHDGARDKTRILSEVTWMANRDETQKLFLNIEKTMQKACVTFRNLDEIIVISGPGPYAGLRIGVATANALAFCLGIGVRPIKTKDFLASLNCCGLRPHFCLASASLRPVEKKELNQDSLAAIDLRKPAHALIASGCEGKVCKIAVPIYFKPPLISKMKKR